MYHQAHIVNLRCLFVTTELQICQDSWAGCSSGVGYKQHWTAQHGDRVMQWPTIVKPPGHGETPRHAKQMQFNVTLGKVNISGSAAQRNLEHAHFGQDHAVQLACCSGNTRSPAV